MKCYHCQSNIPDGSKFCTYCGQAQGFDQRLINAAAAGDNQAITELYNKTYSSVYHTIRNTKTAKKITKEELRIYSRKRLFIKQFPKGLLP